MKPLLKVIAVWACLFLILARPLAAAVDLTPILREEMSGVPTDPVQEYVNKLDQNIQNLLPHWDPEGWAKNGLGFGLADLIKGLLRIAVKEVFLNFKLLGQVIVLAAICAILHRLQTAWLSENVTDLAYSITYLVVIGLAIGSFVTTLNLAKSMLETASGFLYALLPALMPLFVAAGGVTTATVMHPLMVAGIGLIVQIVKDYMLPLAYLSGAISLVGHLAEGFSLSRLSGLIRQVVISGLGLLMSIFLGIVTIQGLTASVADGVSLRAAKYVTGNFVPVVGGTLSDSMELAAGCSLLLKNGIGSFGAVVVLLICMVPMLKILAISLIYRFASAIVQPLGNERLSSALQDIANTFTLVFGAMAIVSLMFFIGLAIVVGIVASPGGMR
ncbi:MAG TPA: stage III sporulation protein AE [Bacillota bacterium]|nr:stage III sporulation protein AE [Bacillota bacterium]